MDQPLLSEKTSAAPPQGESTANDPSAVAAEPAQTAEQNRSCGRLAKPLGSPSFSAPGEPSSTQAATDRLGREQRLMLAALGAGLLTLLALALKLEPDRTGYGTHRQLGLPPCTFVTLFGNRCPSCGMTTSWAYLMQGQWTRAVEANSGGTLLGLLALLAAPWTLASSVRGRLVWGDPGQRAYIAVVIVVVVVTMMQWGWRMVGGP